jgi:hypothetical protein
MGVVPGEHTPDWVVTQMPKATSRLLGERAFSY